MIVHDCNWLRIHCTWNNCGGFGNNLITLANRSELGLDCNHHNLLPRDKRYRSRITLIGKLGLEITTDSCELPELLV